MLLLTKHELKIQFPKKAYSIMPKPLTGDSGVVSNRMQ